MPQMHFSVPESVAEEIRQRAKSEGLTVSKYLASIVKAKVHPGWPKGYFEKVLGGWQGPPLERAPQGEPEEREPICPSS